MCANDQIISKEIQSRIYTIRSLQVMVDRDLASLYDVETRVLNQAVKRNSERFPDDYCFQLNDEEFTNWKSQIVMSNEDRMGLRRPPYAFTEQGVAMLSAVLRSVTAVKVSIQIINAFVAMRRFIGSNAQVFQRLDALEIKQLKIAPLEKLNKFNQFTSTFIDKLRENAKQIHTLEKQGYNCNYTYCPDIPPTNK